MEASLQALKEDEGSEGDGGMQLCEMEGIGNEVGCLHCEFEDEGRYSGQANRWVMKRTHQQMLACGRRKDLSVQWRRVGWVEPLSCNEITRESV